MLIVREEAAFSTRVWCNKTIAMTEANQNESNTSGASHQPTHLFVYSMHCFLQAVEDLFGDRFGCIQFGRATNSCVMFSALERVKVLKVIFSNITICTRYLTVSTMFHTLRVSGEVGRRDFMALGRNPERNFGLRKKKKNPRGVQKSEKRQA